MLHAAGGASQSLAASGKLDTLKIAELDEYLTLHRLKKSGNKGEKVQRIMEHLNA